MSDKKTLFKLLIAIVSLLVIAATLFTLFVYVIPKKEKRIFSEQEVIDVNIENKKIVFFETNDFLGKNKNDIYDKLNNVILIEDNKITMNDIILFDTNGDFIIEISDNNIISGTFISTELSSAQDLDYVCKNINKLYAEKNKIKEEKIYLIDKDGNKCEYTSPDMLYDTEKYIFIEYKSNDFITTFNSSYLNNAYQLKLITKKNP